MISVIKLEEQGVTVTYEGANAIRLSEESPNGFEIIIDTNQAKFVKEALNTILRVTNATG